MSDTKKEVKMTKLLALLCLVLSALLTVGHFTESEGDAIVKDGHRVVVVEYDGDGKTNTRVLISPPGKGQEKTEDEREVFRNVKKKVIETASSLPVIGQAEEEREVHTSPGELICDATGKCKHKMTSVLRRGVNDRTAYDAKETVARVARDVKESLAHEAQYAEKKVEGKAHETRGTVSEMATTESHKTQNVWEKGRLTVRRLGTVVAAALKLSKIGSVVSLVGISAAYGMCVWVTVLSKYLLASVLGRQQSGVVQRKLYPVYFKAISVGILVGLLGHVISRRRKVLTDAVEMWQAVNLLSSILMVEANASFVEPRAIKAMCERLKVEKEERRGLDTSESQSSTEAAARTGGEKIIKKMDEDAVKQRLTKLSERLSRLNAYSSRLNLLTLMSLTWHFVYLGHRLSLGC